MSGAPILVPDFETATLGFLVFLIGALITRRVKVLRDFNIPEPVTGGLLAAALTLCLFLLLNRPIEFDLRIRDYFLIVFFSGIGLNARLADLIRGGKPLLILLGLTIVLLLLQNILGILTALVFGQPFQIGILLGSVSLVGGHGTTIAWAPEITRITGIAGVQELGIATATIGLIIGALIGGPLARLLIERGNLMPNQPEAAPAAGLAFDKEKSVAITPVDLMRTMFVLHLAIIIGLALHDLIQAAGLRLPAFVPCMLVSIVLGNLLPVVAPTMPSVPRSPTLSLITDFALGTFLAMSLMSMQLWTLAGMGTMVVVSLVLQTALAIAFTLFAVYRLMGRDYFAAVLAAGYAGFSVGATPTAIANMNAVTKRYGPSPLAFVILPLITAFFVDLANAAAIQLFLSF
ncbi:MAG: sodium/glutamate symporter [Cereibacter sphaeroides]|uniref:Sodium/glutamate symporter n=1 Tax=Cereibacter sphaeroides TaxID=1063 RepID=A0A2W5SEJ0_CERSP|nr:MAG: sodium/glutamate symporter [Cereibacter sphaeroides]